MHNVNLMWFNCKDVFSVDILDNRVPEFALRPRLSEGCISTDVSLRALENVFFMYGIMTESQAGPPSSHVLQKAIPLSFVQFIFHLGCHFGRSITPYCVDRNGYFKICSHL